MTKDQEAPLTTKEEMAEAITRVLRAFSCPEITTAALIDGEPGMLGVESTDGVLFTVTVADL